MRTLAVLLPALAWAPALAAPAVPHRSWDRASLANGLVAAVYDTAAGKLADLYPRVYRERSAGVVTPDMLFDAFFGAAAGGTATWLVAVPPLTVSYENGTGILVVVREWKGLRFTERWTATFATARPLVIGTVTVRNLGPVPVTGARLFTLHNFHVGPGTPEASAASEETAWDPIPGVFRETGTTSGRVACVRPLEPPSRRAGGPTNPYSEVPTLGFVTPSDGAPARDDAVTAFEWDLDPLPGGGELTVGVAMAVAGPGDPDPCEAVAGPQGGSSSILEAERSFWQSFHQADLLPDSIAGDGLALARQSLAWLVMSQVREAGQGHGQVLASLPPGQWNRTWVRDMAYSAVALSATGHVAQAANAVRFVANAGAGGFEAYVGMPYGVSVCRYYGDGTEESDANEFGPNVEFDGFGLSLWALHEAVAGGDESLLVDAWPRLRDGAANVLLSLIEPSGLVAADSGIWEHHWNGRQKHFANTSLAAALGLCAAADLADRTGASGEGSGFREAARQVVAGIADRLVTGGVLAGNTEEMPAGEALDAAVVEAFAWGVLDPTGPLAQSTLDALLGGLGVPTGHGLRRNDDGGWYDRQEWVFIDLRTAVALRRAGRTEEAEALAGWVLAQTRANLDQVAELYTEDAADYAGAVPMSGFGAASWLLWAVDHHPSVDLTACLRPAPPEPSPESVPEPATGEVFEPGADQAVEAAVEVPLDVARTPEDAGDPAGGPDPARPSGSPGGCVAGTCVPSPATVLWLGLAIMAGALHRLARARARAPSRPA